MKKKLQKFLPILALAVLLSCNRNSKIKDLDLIPIEMGENFQYINTKGTIIINPQFSNASVFRDGIALVRTSGENPKWGYIDKEGKYKINPVYKSATIFSEAIAFVVSENGAPTAITTNGEIKFVLKDVKTIRHFKEGLAAFTKQDTIQKWGFIDQNGKSQINEQFYEVSDFSEGKCAIKNKNDKWGYIDKNGKTIINCQFEGASDFTDKTAIVYLKEKAGVIDENGKYIINPQFTAIYNDEEMYLFQQDDKWGWCDKNGKIIINPQFETASKFNNNNIAAIKIDKQYGYIDKKGKIVINQQFDYATVFNNNLALAKSGNKIGFIDKEGKFIINPQYTGYSFDYLSYINSGTTIFSEVDTDFFDISKIIEKINLEAPEGLSLTNSYSEILQKFKIKSLEINKNQEEITLYNNKEIIPNAKISFQVIGSAFQYDSEYAKNFMPRNKPDGFVYKINLSGRASGKCKEITNSLKLEDYELLKAGFVKDNPVAVYKAKGRQIVVTSDRNTLLIYVLKVDYDLKAYTARITKLQNETPETSDNQEY